MYHRGNIGDISMTAHLFNKMYVLGIVLLSEIIRQVRGKYVVVAKVELI